MTFSQVLRRAGALLAEEQRAVLVVDPVDHDLELVADLQFLRLDRDRQLAEAEDTFGLAADVDEQLVLILRDDETREDLALIENLEALLVHALLERELIFEFFRLRRSDVGSCNANPLHSGAGSNRPVTPFETHPSASRTSLDSEAAVIVGRCGTRKFRVVR